MTPEQQQLTELIAEAEIGEQARKFMEGELGRTLLGMAQQDIDAAQEALETVDPDDKAAITKLQNKAALGRMFAGYLTELFNRGDQALGVFLHESQN